MRKVFAIVFLGLFLLAILYFFKTGSMGFTESLWLAKLGHPGAQFIVGVMYHEGKEVPQDYKEAMNWYRKSAQQGYSLSQRRIGVLYDKGLGVPRDSKEAFHWYLKSADQGDAVAQFNVGRMYYTGDGVSKGYQEALKWYLKSAEQGDTYAQKNLGYFHMLGNGTPKDFSRAYMWFSLAGSGRNEADKSAITEATRNATILARERSPGEIEEGRRLAREWLAAHPQK